MYRAITEMVVSPSLIDRLAACLATLHVPNPRQVAVENAYRFASTEGWADAWQSAVDGYNVNQNPDTGARTDVISDDMILAGISALYGPTVRTDETGAVTTKAADPTLSPEEGGPVFTVEQPHEHGHDDPTTDPHQQTHAVRHPRGT